MWSNNKLKTPHDALFVNLHTKFKWNFECCEHAEYKDEFC